MKKYIAFLIGLFLVFSSVVHSSGNPTALYFLKEKTESLNQYFDFNIEYLEKKGIEFVLFLSDLDMNGNDIINVGSVCIDNECRNTWKSTIYNASNITTLTGTPSGTIAGIQNYRDGISYNVTEVVKITPIDIRVNFTNVSSFTHFFIREKYTGITAHNIRVSFWDYGYSVWEEYYRFSTQTDFVEFEKMIFDSTNHLNNGTVQLRIEHIENGAEGHLLEIGYFILIDEHNNGH